MGMVRPPPVPLLLASVRAISSATLPSASVAMAQVREAISLALRPALIDSRKITRSRAG